MTAGVYAIAHKATGEKYIGSSSNIEKRWRQHIHLLQQGNHHSKQLQTDWNTDGEIAFSWIVLETFMLPTSKVLQVAEQKHIDEQKPTYNSSRKAQNNFGVRWSAEAIQGVRLLNEKRKSIHGDRKQKTRKKAVPIQRYETKNYQETKARIEKIKKGNIFSVSDAIIACCLESEEAISAKIILTSPLAKKMNLCHDSIRGELRRLEEKQIINKVGYGYYLLSSLYR